jgi:hypothetical protein
VDTSRDELDRLAIAAGKQEHRPMLGMYTALLGYDVEGLSLSFRAYQIW